MCTVGRCLWHRGQKHSAPADSTSEKNVLRELSQKNYSRRRSRAAAARRPRSAPHTGAGARMSAGSAAGTAASATAGVTSGVAVVSAVAVAVAVSVVFAACVSAAGAARPAAIPFPYPHSPPQPGFRSRRISQNIPFVSSSRDRLRLIQPNRLQQKRGRKHRRLNHIMRGWSAEFAQKEISRNYFFGCGESLPISALVPIF